MPKIKNTKIGSVYPFLDARTPMVGSDLLPVKISVILRGKQFRVGVKLYTTPDIFNKAMTGKGTIGREAKILKDEIDAYVKKAKDILEQFPTADKKMFTNLFKSETALKVSGKTDMGILFKQKIDELTEEDRAGSISFYEQALSVFKRFRKHFYLEDITVEYLKAFKGWWKQYETARQQEVWLTRKEVTEILSISLPTLSTWSKNGTIPGYRIGGLVRYKRSEIDGALKQMRTSNSRRR